MRLLAWAFTLAGMLLMPISTSSPKCSFDLVLQVKAVDQRDPLVTLGIGLAGCAVPVATMNPPVARISSTTAPNARTDSTSTTLVPLGLDHTAHR